MARSCVLSFLPSRLTGTGWLPTFATGSAFEGSGQIGGDPAPIERARLWLGRRSADTAVKIVGIEGHTAGERPGMFDRSALEEVLRKLRMSPVYRLTVPHSMVIPDLLEGSDMVAILPRMLADLFCKTRGMVQRPLPYEARFTSLSAVWHKSSDDDPAHAWFRDHVVRIAQQWAP